LLSGAVATFEVSESGALVAIYASEPGAVFVELSTPDGVVQTPSVDVGPATGNTALVELVDLEPDTAYDYRVVSESGAESAPFRLRTAPPPDVAAELTFVYSADLDLNPLFDSPILETLAATPAAFFVSLGDWPYADNAPGAWTLAEYRQRHLEAREASRVQAMLQRLPVYAIYDDHEARNDWDAHFREVEGDRIRTALQVWDEWFPLRDASDPRVRYRSWKWGALVELFLLDTRLYRSANKDDDGPDKTMLGAVQKQWLMDGLAASAAPYKLVLTTVPLDFGESDSNDGWRSFRTERDELLDFIVDEGLSGVVFLAADRHWFAAHHHTVGIKEFQVGPIARGLPELEPAAPEVVARESTYNFGEVTVRAGALSFTARAADGRAIYSEAVPPGRGVLRVESVPPGRAFVATGAHRFAGVTPALLAYATPGHYAVEFDEAGPIVEGELVDGEELVLTG
jgi:alkaline phosphatase D